MGIHMGIKQGINVIRFTLIPLNHRLLYLSAYEVRQNTHPEAIYLPPRSQACSASSRKAPQVLSPDRFAGVRRTEAPSGLWERSSRWPLCPRP